jgi:hypothetical protein
MNHMKLALDQISLDGGTQTRAEINNETVAEYAEAVTDGAQFPPVEIFHDGVTHWLADGFHRVHAHRQAGVVDIEANVRTGTLDDAILFALSANSTNGLRRTNADKRRCVEIALNRWPDWSARRIAEVCGVGDQLVSKIAHVRDSRTCAKNDTFTKVGKDGKIYPTDRTPDPDPDPIPDPPEEISPEGPAPTEENAPCEGMAWAEKAIKCLEKIDRYDSQRKRAIKFVCKWIELHCYGI